MNSKVQKSEGPRPRVSIVIPTRNRKKGLEACLRSLAPELPGPEAAEILVVDSGSRDETCAFVADLANRNGNGSDQKIPIRYFYEKNASASVARNLGAGEARGEWVAFLDDDCEVQPGWFRQMVSAMGKNVEAVGGPAKVPEGGPYPGWFHSAWESLDLGPQSGPFVPSLYPMECNLAVRRERFEQLQGMNPNLGPSMARQGFHEGPEMIRRLRIICPQPEAVWYAGEARVWHRIDPGKVRVRSRLVRSFFAGIDHTRAQGPLAPRTPGRVLQDFFQAAGRAGSCLWQPVWARLRMGQAEWIEWLYVNEARNFYRLGEKLQELIGGLGRPVVNFQRPLELKQVLRNPLLRLWKGFGRAAGVVRLPYFVIGDLIPSLSKDETDKILWTRQPDKEPRMPSRMALEDVHPHLVEVRPVDRPRLWIASLREAEVHGPSVGVTTRKGGLVGETSIEWGHAPEEHGVMRRFFLPPATRLHGKSLLLGSTGGNTYHHWMLDILPRLRLLAEAGMDPSEFDHILVNGFQLPFQRESLEVLGTDFDRCRSLNDRVRYQCEQLILPSLPAPLGHPSRENLKFLRSIFLRGEVPAVKKRLLVGREPGQSRQVAGWEQLREVLVRHGFEECFPGRLSVREQATLFQAAEWVVGVHGSALTNLAFCSPGTRVLEIFGWSYVNPCYRDLCGAADLLHHAVIGEGPGQPRLCLDLDNAKENIRIRIEKVLQLLRESGCPVETAARKTP